MEKSAAVYTQQEHRIDLSLVDPDAVRIVQRLQKSGYTAYLVGGAVRDLLLGKRPKDFDLVTSAEPNQIRKTFRNSRIIGKRFRLVHVFFRDEKIIEVSTFRSIEAGTFNNVFGTIDEDAKRRDFSINALYYDPVEQQLLDFVGGFKDVRARRLVPLIPRETIFVEDPVRMIRAVKYSCSTGCRIGWFLKRDIKKAAPLLAEVSPSRLSEEAFKILQGGHAVPIIKSLQDYGLLVAIMPRLSSLLSDPATQDFARRFYQSMASLDQAVQAHHESRRSIQLAYLLGDYFYTQSTWAQSKKVDFVQAYQDLKDFLKPVTPPNIEVERCLVYLMRKRSLSQQQGKMVPVDAAFVPDEPGEYAKDLARLRDAREGRDGRRRKKPAAGPGVPALANVPPTVKSGPKAEEGTAKPRRRRRPRKKSPAPGTQES